MGRAQTWATLLLAALGTAAPLAAATIYRWTDARGVIHFADVPPHEGITSTAQRLPARPRRPAGTAADIEAAPAAPAAAAAEGPARVVITDREEGSLGGALQTFSGKVKNEGGREARDVSIAVRVVEPTQGDECVADSIDVEPSTLAPGATGTFAGDFDSPCFLGPTQTELRAEWD